MTTSAISRLGRSPEEGIKAPCKTSTTVDITLQGTGQSLNGVVTGTGDRVMVKDQTIPGQNGIYKVGPDAWERTTDMNAADDVDNGQLVVDANTGTLYVITLASVWDPGATPINFIPFATMPARAVITDNNTIDLVDTIVALTTGALDPDTQQHLEYDHSSVQSKANATTAAVLNLNPLGGDVNILENLLIGGLVDGVDIASFSAAMALHVGDASIHFTQASISITASQVSDFDAAVAVNAAVAANTTKVSNVSTALALGALTASTIPINSDGTGVVLPSFTSTEAGLTPASGGGTANFLRADGSFAAPPSADGNLINVSFITASDAAWAPNPSTTKMFIIATAAGAGGGATDGGGSNGSQGRSGSAGATCLRYLTTIDPTYNITIGAGGVGGVTPSGNGNDGGDTTVVGSVGPGTNCDLDAGGGTGGTGSTSGTNQTRTGDKGGTATGGDVNIAGGDSSSGAVLAGRPTASNTSGASYWGGAVRVTNEATGDNALAPGAGGGVTSSINNAANFAGGDGADGIVVIYEYS